MLKQLIKFELTFQLKSLAFIGFSIIFLAFGFMLGSQGFAPAEVNFNSPYQISYNIALTSLGSVFAIMFFVIRGILRDKQYNFESIIYTTSITKKEYFFSRYLGILIASVLAFSMSLLGYFLGTLSPSLDPNRIMPFKLSYYSWTWLVIALPNILICTTLIFSISALTKNRLVTYISAVFIYATYFISSTLFNSPIMANSVSNSSNESQIASLIDPFGLSAFFQQTEYWSYIQKNNELLILTGNFLLNRIIWVVGVLILLMITLKKYKFKKINYKVKKRKSEGK